MPDVSDAPFAGPLDSITDAEVLDVDVGDEALEAGARAKAEDKEPAPDPEALERSIRRRRRELIAHMHELETVVRAKLDVRSRIRHTTERAAEQAEHAIDHLMVRVRARPLPYLIVGGLMIWMLFGRRRTYRF